MAFGGKWEIFVAAHLPRLHKEKQNLFDYVTFCYYCIRISKEVSNLNFASKMADNVLRLAPLEFAHILDVTANVTYVETG